MGPLISDEHLPITLADLLANTLVLRQTSPYLPVPSVCSLLQTSKSIRNIILQSPEAFRYLDLSSVKSAIVPFDGPLDAGGVSWRAERMDESLSEDDFYSGPLRGIFSRLERRHLLQKVQTMILDGLSVTAEFVKELLTQERFNVRILSIREVKHLNERKLQQYLRYAVRPSRPAGTPRVIGIYIFGPRDTNLSSAPSHVRGLPQPGPQGVMSSQGAQIGAEWNQKSTDALNAVLARTDDKWYQASGKIITKRPSPEWAEVVQACENIIHFDAVLCRGPRHDPSRASKALHPIDYLRPAIATVALGPDGCESCNSCPEGPAYYGESHQSEFPLLAPVPKHGSSLRAAQMPQTTNGAKPPPPLYARCEDCLKGRWCERCHKWWDENCYIGSAVARRTELQQMEYTESIGPDGTSCLLPKHIIKVIGVYRDCFGCGHTCIGCKEVFIRSCGKCKSEYCHEDDDSSSDSKCGWCNHTRRRTREMY